MPQRLTRVKRRLDFWEDEGNNNGGGINGVKCNKKEVVVEVLSLSTLSSPVLNKKKKTHCGNDDKDGIMTYFSPRKESSSSPSEVTAVVTLDKIKQDTKSEEKTTKNDDVKVYVPINIHKNVNYQRRGQTNLSLYFLHIQSNFHCYQIVGFIQFSKFWYWNYFKWMKSMATYFSQSVLVLLFPKIQQSTLCHGYWWCYWPFWF